MEILRIDAPIGKDEAQSIFDSGRKNFSLAQLNKFLDGIAPEEKDLTVEINSEGGEVTEGFAIHDKLIASGLNIYTEVTGLCGSIATVIALAAPIENRSMHLNSKYFIHNPWWMPNAPEPYEAEDLDSLSGELKVCREDILNHYVKKTGQTKAKLQAFMKQKKNMSAQEAKEFGFISEIISAPSQIEAPKNYKIAAYVNIKSTEMEFSANQKSWLETQFSSLMTKFNKAFTPVFKGMLIELGNGGKIWVDSEDEDIAGKKVFNVDADGNKTNEAAPDGEYITKDGKTIVVKDGAVSEVKEAAAAATEEVSALKKQVADLTAELATSNTKAQTAEAAKAQAETAKVETEKNLLSLKTDFLALQKVVLGKDVTPAGQEFKGAKPEVQDANQKWLELKRAEKAKKAASIKK